MCDVWASFSGLYTTWSMDEVDCITYKPFPPPWECNECQFEAGMWVLYAL